MPNLRLFLAVLLLASPLLAHAQVPGCTDPQANNYNPVATSNDGSCMYTAAVLSPNIVLDPLPAGLEESSGLVGVNGAHWTHNDSGDDPILYRIDPVAGTIEQEIFLANATNQDWEDIAQDSAYLYVGEFGNNNGNRTNLKIYRVPKADIPASGDDTLTVDTIAFDYPDQTDFSSQPQNHNFDCEAFFAYRDSLYLFSKNWVDQQTKLYRLPTTPGMYTAELIDSFDVGALITGADYNPLTDQAVLIGYDDNGFNTKAYLWLLFDFQPGQPFSGNKRPFDYGSVAFAGQVEAIAYLDSFEVRITNEQITISPFTVTAKLHQWNTETYVTNTMTGWETKQDPSGAEVFPNPITAESRLRLPIPTGSEVECEIVDLLGREWSSGFIKYTSEGIPMGESLPPGEYLLKVRTAQQNYTLRLLH